MLLILFSQTLFAQEPTLDETEENVPSEASTQESPQMVEVKLSLNNGVVLIGKIPVNEMINWSPEKDDIIHFKMNGSTPSDILSSKIQSIRTIQSIELEPKPITIQTETKPKQEPVAENTYKSEKGFSYQNPAASRYLYAPSSIGMQKGQGYVAQKLLFTTGVYAITDNITVLAGGLGPFLTVAGGKISTQVSDDLHLSAGSEVFILPFDSEIVANINFAGFTYGNLDQHISISSGYITMPFAEIQGVPIVLSGHTRTSERLAFITENWLLLDIDSSQFIAINSLAVRIIGKRDSSSQIKGRLITKSGYPRSTWDLGFLFMYGGQEYGEHNGNEYIQSDFLVPFKFGPIPWIDYTWHFGPARK